MSEPTETTVKELTQAVKALTAAITKAGSFAPSQRTGAQSSGRGNPDSKEERVGDVVSDTGSWGDTEIPFGKMKGKPLSRVPASYVLWLADNWSPKGYDNDEAMCAMIEAVCKAKGRDLPDYTANRDNDDDGRNATRPAQSTAPAREDDEEDIPF